MTRVMQIWRMRPDGGDQQPVTSDGHADWFPHRSPDGKCGQGTINVPSWSPDSKHIAFVSYRLVR